MFFVFLFSILVVIQNPSILWTKIWTKTVSIEGDCDDADPTLNPEDKDGDGFSRGTGDCSDLDPYVFTGVAYREQELGCMKDADGDGYGDANPPALVTLVLIVMIQMKPLVLSITMMMEWRDVQEIAMTVTHSHLQEVLS